MDIHHIRCTIRLAWDKENVIKGKTLFTKLIVYISIQHKLTSRKHFEFLIYYSYNHTTFN